MRRMLFPPDFIWGAATAAYQIEGAVREGGRGETIWDRFSHTPGKTLNGDTGDVACDHYHRFPEDLRLMKELGLKGYRFSIAWSRIFPEGKGRPNKAGVNFYHRLIDGLLASGIEPIITLYHWDLPQALQEEGGWLNRTTIAAYARYAAYLFDTFGDRVKKWITLNEPWVVAFAGHFQGRHAPGLASFPAAVQVTHHLLLAHARAVESYRQAKQGDGKIGITLNLYPTYPATETAADQKAATFVDGYYNRWFLDPVFKGAYPADLLHLYTTAGCAPVLLPGDQKLIAAQKVDFLGVNYYFRRVVRSSPVHPILQFEEVKPEGTYTKMDWEVYPAGLYDLLIRLDRDYDHPELYITENGAAFDDGPPVGGMVADDERVAYLKQHIAAAHRAIQDGVRLKAYYVWSLLDNFEWAHGYSKRFGLFYIDYQTLAREWKKSGCWYREVIKNNGLLDH